MENAQYESATAATAGDGKPIIVNEHNKEV